MGALSGPKSGSFQVAVTEEGFHMSFKFCSLKFLNICRQHSILPHPFLLPLFLLRIKTLFFIPLSSSFVRPSLVFRSDGGKAPRLIY